jgi:predicted dehydrogenase
VNGALRIAVVGLGHFGQIFIPEFLDHPLVEEVVPFDVDGARQDAVCRRFNVQRRFGSFEEILASDEIDAVFLATSLPAHAPQALAALQASKHCCCAVTMGTSIDELEAIVVAQRETGRSYMMFETAAYSREFLYLQQLLRQGELGQIQFMRGSFIFDHEAQPEYWRSVPPMHYATHAIGPLLALAKTRANKVHCLGSGMRRPELRGANGNGDALETALFRLEGTTAVAEITQALFGVAREAVESFSVYGDRVSFEWQQLEAEEPILHRAAAFVDGAYTYAAGEHVAVPDFADLLPVEVRHRTTANVAFELDGREYDVPAPHGGSHPHLVHEFVSSIVEGRLPYPDAVVSAQWTAAGICAHESAILDGDGVAIPSFTDLE